MTESTEPATEPGRLRRVLQSRAARVAVMLALTASIGVGAYSVGQQHGAESAAAIITNASTGKRNAAVRVAANEHLCHAPAGTPPGVAVDCAILPAALDRLYPGGAMPAETDWPAVEDAAERDRWCWPHAEKPGLLTCVN